jgi:predicted house-cleaning noncanonical NTP pyrophosphatase (MazG superfamily)
MIITHNKLVRDYIPNVLSNKGIKFETKSLTIDQMAIALDEKLNEEVKEYQKDKNIDELADVIEVIKNICRLNNISFWDLMNKVDYKRACHGGFDRGIFLISTEEKK